VQDYADKVPRHWLKEGGFFIPMHQREAMFLEFSGFKWHPQAAKIAVGNINAVTGEEFSQSIRAHRQDYVVIPDQKWLDGINSMNGRVRQFVAMPLGKGYTIEEQVTDEAKFGGIQIGVFDVRPGLFPDEDPQALQRRLKELEAREKARKRREELGDVMFMPGVPGPHRPEDDIEMGIAAGGSIRQQIFEDQYGYHTWDEESFVQLTIRIVDTVAFKRITGRDAPPTPVSAEHYTRAGLPWFRYYNEAAPSLAPSGLLARIRGVRHIDRLKGGQSTTPELPIQIKPEQLREIAVPTRAQRTSELREVCETCLRAGRYALGKRQADLLLELSPKDVTGLMVRAKCNHRLSRFQEAILDASEYLEETDPKDPATPTALLYRGDSFARLGKVSQAITDFEQVMSLVPDTKQARYAAEMLKKIRLPAKQQNREMPAPEEQQSRLSKNLGLYNEMLAERAEILKHQRKLGEKAGREIGFEEAMLDWIEKHRADWRQQRQREQNAAEG
jgi:tetratricopeptide (TPR) repeat protein